MEMLIPIKYRVKYPTRRYVQYPTHLWAPKKAFGRPKVPYTGETADNETHWHPTLPTLRVLILIKYCTQSPPETYVQYPTHLWAPKKAFGRPKVPYTGETADNETHWQPTQPTLRVRIGRC
jgi:hypothetical protein